MAVINTDSDRNTDSNRIISTSNREQIVPNSRGTLASMDKKFQDQDIESNTKPIRSELNKSDLLEQSKSPVKAKQPIALPKKASALFDDDPLFGDPPPSTSNTTSKATTTSHLKASTASTAAADMKNSTGLSSSSRVVQAAVGSVNPLSSYPSSSTSFNPPSSSTSYPSSTSHSRGTDPLNTPVTTPALSSFSSGFENPLFSVSNKTASIPFMTDPLSTGSKSSSLSHQQHSVTSTHKAPKTPFDPLLGPKTNPLSGPKIPIGAVVAHGMSSMGEIGVKTQGAGIIFGASGSGVGDVDRMIHSSAGQGRTSSGLGGKIGSNVSKNSSLFGDDDDDIMGGKVKGSTRTSKLRKSSSSLFDD
jgi:hypothetical protein